MKVYLLTTTGARPKAFALCEKWIKRQTYQLSDPNDWVVVDDGRAKTKTTANQTVLRPTPYWKDGFNTQARNLKVGLEYLQTITNPTDAIFFIEDDDYYKPNYLESKLKYFKSKIQIAGESRPVYYNLQFLKYKYVRTPNYATLAQTGILASLIPTFLTILDKHQTGLDYQIWTQARKEKAISILHPQSINVVGMKGLPGRKGIGIGHTPLGKWANDDRNLSKLCSLVGEDIEHYKPFLAKDPSLDPELATNLFNEMTKIVTNDLL